MKKATKIKELNNCRPGQQQHLFQMNPPLEENEYVIVSAILLAFDTGVPETYIFGADVDGNIVDWRELEGSFQGAIDIEKAINNAGYDIVNEN